MSGLAGNREETRASRPWRDAAALTLFSFTMFLGATLLFCVQPMVAKMVLPALGGSPAVWNTCMVFFQSALLAGYAYAHWSTTKLAPRAQAVVHGVLLLLPLIVLPIGVGRGWMGAPPSQADPGLWLLGLLLVTVGMPFFAVSTTAPLLQRWFSRMDHPSADDPYFLYGASNLGSMLALLAYPLVIEPNLPVARQGEFWAVRYLVLAFLIAACGVLMGRASIRIRHEPTTEVLDASADQPRPGLSLWARWVALAFLPSSLMLGVTTYLTTDLTPIPLLWVIPLALYLLTFILVFARKPILPHSWMIRLMPMMIVLLTLILCLNTTQILVVPVHLLTFFAAAMVCHGELARHRPSARHLTAFYLAMSLGGVLGGVFNALVAPQIFSWVAEYPLVLALSCLALPWAENAPRKSLRRALDLILPVVLTVAPFVLIVKALPALSSVEPSMALKIASAVAVLIAFGFKAHPLRFSLSIGAVLLASYFILNSGQRILLQERNFFGVLRVTEGSAGSWRRLVHGNTLHGQQNLGDDRKRVPLTYYHRSGPVGQIFEVVSQRMPNAGIAAVGLGTGTLASYATPGQDWVFYEIDPAVARIASDPRYFSFLTDCRARSHKIVLGDARLRLQDAADHTYGLILLDAFSSDAIPTHLLTREALALYRTKLTTDGLLALHITNRYLNLTPVLAALAHDAGLVCRVRRDITMTSSEILEGKQSSIWAVMAASESDLGTLATDPRWTTPTLPANESVWTDDFSDLVRHFTFKRR